MTLVISVVFIVCCMINDIVFNGNGIHEVGLAVYLGIVIAYLVAFAVWLIIPKRGMRKEAWQQIVQKANTTLSHKDYAEQITLVLGAQAAGRLLSRCDNPHLKDAGSAFDAAAAVGSVLTVHQMTSEVSRNVKTVAQVLGVTLPKAGKYVLAVVLLPILLLVGVYIPQFGASKQASDASRKAASETVYAVQAALEPGCDHVQIDDPLERYRSTGYSVSGYLYDRESPYDSYVSVSIGNDGRIKETVYVMDIDIQATKEENLSRAKTELEKMNSLLIDSGAPALSANVLAKVTLPEEFTAQFAQASYYETVDVDIDDNAYVRYHTDPEEEYDEYSSSYFYFRIKAEKD